MFVHTDINGTQIVVGNVILYVQQGGYGGIPNMAYGEVVGFTKTTVKVQPLEPSGKPKQRNKGEWVMLGTFSPSYGGSMREDREYRIIGHEDVSVEAIKNTSNARFYIVR